MIFRKQKEIIGHAGAIYSCTYNDGLVYTGSADKFVARWLTDEGVQDKFAIKFDDPVYKVKIVADKLLCGTSKGTFYVFDLIERKEIKHITQHKSAVFSITINEKFNHVYLGDADGNFSVWDSNDFELLIYLPFDCGKIRDIQVDEKSDKIALSCQDGKIRVLDSNTYNTLHEFDAHKDGTSSSLFFSDKLITGGKDAMLRLWDLESGNCLKEIPAHNFAIYRLLKVGDKIVSISRDKTVKIWDEHLNFLQRLDRKEGGHSHSVNDCCPVSDSEFITCGDDKRLIFWEQIEE